MANCNAALNKVVDSIKTIPASGVNRNALRRVVRKLARLANRGDLFARDEFPLTVGDANILDTLLCDSDSHHALYLSSASVGKSAPPHTPGRFSISLPILISADYLNPSAR